MKLKLRKPAWTEKRSSIRLEMECPAVFRVVETKLLVFKKVGRGVSSMMMKPSMTGLRLTGPEVLPAGCELAIEVQLQKIGFPRSYHLKGKVMWSEYSGKTKRFEHGVKLNHGGPDHSRWGKFILERLKAIDGGIRSSDFDARAD